MVRVKVRILKANLLVITRSRVLNNCILSVSGTYLPCSYLIVFTLKICYLTGRNKKYNNNVNVLWSPNT